MSDLFAQGGAGGVGGLLGAFFSWLGFRQRLDAQDKRVDILADCVVYEDACKATTNGLQKRMDDQSELLTEMRGDIKKLLRRTP